MKYYLISLLALFAVAMSDAAAKKPTGKGPCKHGRQCAEGVCVEVNDESYCSKTCGKCPAGMFCDDQLFAMTGLEVCIQGAKSEPPKPKKPPRVPCKTDAECPGALICAEMMGQRDCTIRCKKNSQCKMPEMMGVKMDFMACQLDRGKRGRKACLPKKKCLANPFSCVSINSSAIGQMAQGMPGAAGAQQPGFPGQAAPSMPTMDNTPKAQPEAESSPKPKKPEKQAMAPGRFKKLLKQVKSKSFEDERNAVLSTAAKRNHFSCKQVGRVLSGISFGDEQLSALRILAPRIVDKENNHTLLEHFDFGDEKKQARQILDD